ncbi:hypothetical protein QL285_051223 [Trifolium repens]|nr:hypothetical protein QL285_051223 [Trifolium repens]
MNNNEKKSSIYNFSDLGCKAHRTTMDPSYYDVWIFLKNITADSVLFLCAKFSSHRATMGKLDFCSNTKVVDLRVSFPKQLTAPQSDTRSSSYGPQTESCAFSSF